MHPGAESEFDKIEVAIDKAQSALQSAPQAFYRDLAIKHFLEAGRLNLEARQTFIQGDKKKSGSLCRRATFHLALAETHGRAKALARRASKKDYLSAMPQQYILLLLQGIIEFKSLIEWKNCTLRETLKSWFVEIVDLYEDALNYLRTGKASAAEHTALAGLLLHEHLCLVAQAEHYDQISITGLCARNKLPTEASNLYKLALTLSRSRRKLNQHLPHLTTAARMEGEKASDAAEDALIQSILAFAAENKKGIEQKLLLLHTNLATIDRITLTSKSGEDASRLLSFETTDSDLEIRQFASQLCTPQDFALESKSFYDLLHERVDDQELLALRVKTISKRFEDLHGQFKTGKHKEAIVLAVQARADLEKLQLLLAQAKLFKDQE